MYQKVIHTQDKGLGLLTETDNGWPFRRRLSVIVGDSVFTREDGQIVHHDKRAISKILSQLIILTWDEGELGEILARHYDPGEEVNEFTFKLGFTRFKVYALRVDEVEIDILIAKADNTDLNAEARQLIKEDLEELLIADLN